MLKTIKNTVPWMGLIGLLIYQFFIFHHYVSHEISGYYPPNYDQASYLTLVYILFEKIKNENLFILFHSPYFLATGPLFPIQTLLFFKMLDPSRASALLPNFIYFALLQISLFWAARKLFHRTAFAWILVGLVLTLETPFYIGGIVDFRMDFIAFCLYGIWSACVLHSQLFLNRKSTYVIAALTVLMVYLRFITLFYLVFIFTGLLFYFSYQTHLGRLIERPRARQRLKHFLMACVALLICVSPLCFFTKDSLYQYYFVMHTHSAEIPFRNVPAHTSILTFYPKIIRKIHFGPMAQKSIEFLMIFYMLIYFFVKIKSTFQLQAYFRKKNIFPSEELFFLGLLIACPILILTIDPTKSYVVGGIVDIPILWTVLYYCHTMQKMISQYTDVQFQNRILSLACIILLGLGGYHQWQSYTQKKTDHKDLSAITQMAEDIGQYAANKNWPNIRLSIDYVTDYLNYGSLTALYYEAHHQLIPILTQRLGSDLFSSINQEEALHSLKSSNVVVLTIGAYPEKAFFPGSEAARALRPALLTYAENNMHVLGDYLIMGYERRVFVQ